MIRGVNGRFDDFSISTKIRQILLHWGYELVERDWIFFVIVVHIKVSYYWFNRNELLQKANNRYHTCGGKEKAAKYYTAKKNAIKGKAKSIQIFQKKKKQKRIWQE